MMEGSSDVMDILEMSGHEGKKMGLMSGDSSKKMVRCKFCEKMNKIIDFAPCYSYYMLQTWKSSSGFLLAFKIQNRTRHMLLIIWTFL